LSPSVLKQSGNELSLIQVCYVLIWSILFYFISFCPLFSLFKFILWLLFSAVCGQIIFRSCMSWWSCWII
jgi:hypothetical protein